MSKEYKDPKPPMLLIALILALAAAITTTILHRPEVLAAQPENHSPALTASDTTATGLDSLYAEINRGFAELEPIFVKGCFDCHTNRTRFPWYHKLPVIRGMIDEDIRGAQKHLNMSSGFPFGKQGNVADDLVGIHDELKGGDMPPLMYRFMHWDAKPSQAEADSIYSWIKRSLAALSAKGIEPTTPPEEDK
jgi:Haem-binding domain